MFYSHSPSVNNDEQVKPRSLRFTWSMKTTSSRDPNDIMAEIRKVDHPQHHEQRRKVIHPLHVLLNTLSSCQQLSPSVPPCSPAQHSRNDLPFNEEGHLTSHTFPSLHHSHRPSPLNFSFLVSLVSPPSALTEMLRSSVIPKLSWSLCAHCCH